MSDYLENLVARTLSPRLSLRPRLPSAFEPAPQELALATPVDFAPQAPLERDPPAQGRGATPLPPAASLAASKTLGREATPLPAQTPPPPGEAPAQAAPHSERPGEPVSASGPGRTGLAQRSQSSPAARREAPQRAVSPGSRAHPPASDPAAKALPASAPPLAPAPVPAATPDEPSAEGPFAPVVIPATAREPADSVTASAAPAPAVPRRTPAIAPRGKSQADHPLPGQIAPLVIRRAVPTGPSLSATPSAALAPTIHVTIGRIEVRAVPPPAPPPSRPRATPRMSLEEYLRYRAGGAQ